MKTIISIIALTFLLQVPVFAQTFNQLADDVSAIRTDMDYQYYHQILKPMPTPYEQEQAVRNQREILSITNPEGFYRAEAAKIFSGEGSAYFSGPDDLMLNSPLKYVD